MKKQHNMEPPRYHVLRETLTAGARARWSIMERYDSFLSGVGLFQRVILEPPFYNEQMANLRCQELESARKSAGIAPSAAPSQEADS